MKERLMVRGKRHWVADKDGKVLLGNYDTYQDAREALAEMERSDKEKGIYGIDLLGYRYTGDAAALNRTFVAAMKEHDIPVCIAGSVDSYQRLDEVKRTGAWSFTVGSAIFENRFDGTFAEQIDKIYDYMQKPV